MSWMRISSSLALVLTLDVPAAGAPTRAAAPRAADVCNGQSITDVAIDESGVFGDDVYLSVTNFRSSRILRMDRDHKLHLFFTYEQVISSITFGDSGDRGRALFASTDTAPARLIEIDPFGNARALTGDLTLRDQSLILADLAFPTSGAFPSRLYVAAGTRYPTGNVLTIDSSGSMEVFSELPRPLFGLAFGNAGFRPQNLFVIDPSVADGLYVVDTNGIVTLPSFATIPGNPVNLALSRGGAFGDYLYVSTFFPGAIYRVDANGNAAPFATGFRFGDGFTGDLCFSVDGSVLYVADNNKLYALADGSSVPVEVAAVCAGTPVAVCRDVEVAAGPGCTAFGSVDGGSYDPDGDAVTVRQSPEGPYPLGTTRVTLIVTDEDALTSECEAKVTVVDATPPEIGNVSASPAVLSPPNHKLTDVVVDYDAVDDCGSATCRIGGVTSNEPVGSGDYVIVDAHHVRLRAGRLGSGAGRIYTVTVVCTDDSGNSSTRSVMVTVPHAPGKKSAATSRGFFRGMTVR